MNDVTSETINRSNYTNEQYLGFLYQLEKLGKEVSCELIVPLPYETKETFFEGVRFLLEAGISVGVYTLMLLIGSELGSRESQEKFSMKKKYRVIPSGFGEYLGDKVIESEPICVENSTMSYNDYLHCRKFSFVVSLFSYKVFDVIRHLLNEFNISYYDYVMKVHERIESDEYGKIPKIISDFGNESENELFDSNSDITEFFSIKENWNRLLSGEVGDNLLRKYVTRTFLLGPEVIFDFAFDIVNSFLSEEGKNRFDEPLCATKIWSKKIFNITSVFSEEIDMLLKKDVLTLDYDVQKWLNRSDQEKSIFEYNKKCTYNVYYDKEFIVGLKGEINDLYGSRTEFALGKLLDTRPASDLFKQCEYAV